MMQNTHTHTMSCFLQGDNITNFSSFFFPTSASFSSTSSSFSYFSFLFLIVKKRGKKYRPPGYNTTFSLIIQDSGLFDTVNVAYTYIYIYLFIFFFSLSLYSLPTDTHTPPDCESSTSFSLLAYSISSQTLSFNFNTYFISHLFTSYILFQYPEKKTLKCIIQKYKRKNYLQFFFTLFNKFFSS